jgi:tripartite-type tricarboxylate transporter receptor subunit TctC
MKSGTVLRHVFALVTVCLTFWIAANVSADDYPSRPIRIVVPLAAGGPGDVLTRLTAESMGHEFGKRLIIENRVGAGSNIGFAAVANTTPDGYTLLAGLPPLAINPSLFKSVPYDPVKSFVPISRMGTFPLVVAVHPSVPGNTLEEFIDYVRKNPGKLDYGSSGNGSTPHLAGVLLEQLTGAKLTHVPYQGVPQAMTDLIANRIQVMFCATSVALPFMPDNKVKVLAVTSNRRSASMPDVPTTVERGLPKFVIGTWYGLLAPAGTPEPIIKRLHDAMRVALAEPSIKTKFSEIGADVMFDESPAHFKAFLDEELRMWPELVKAAGAKLQ